MKLDLSNVKGPGPVPAGAYHVVCTGATEDTVRDGAKNAGEPLLKLEFTVDQGEFEGKKIWDNMVITEGNEERGTKSTMYRIQQLLSALGKDASAEIEFEAEEDILGRELWLDVSIREGRTDPNSGQEYQDTNQIKKFRADDDSAPNLR